MGSDGWLLRFRPAEKPGVPFGGRISLYCKSEFPCPQANREAKVSRPLESAVADNWT